MISETDAMRRTDAPAYMGETPEQTFERLLSRSDTHSGITSFIEVSRDASGKFNLSLTPEGESLDQIYKQASRIADEKGSGDRDVLERLSEVESKWASHPGVVENAINDLIEASDAAQAVE